MNRFVQQNIIYFRKNSTKKITNEILKCNELKTVLEGNTNSIIETQIETQLNHVQLLNHDFQYVDVKSFAEMKNLFEISLSNNKLKSLDSAFFFDQVNLTHLT